MLRKLLVLAVTSGFAAKVFREFMNRLDQQRQEARTAAAEIEDVQAWRHAASDRAVARGSEAKIPPDIP